MVPLPTKHPPNGTVREDVYTQEPKHTHTMVKI